MALFIVMKSAKNKWETLIKNEKLIPFFNINKFRQFSYVTELFIAFSSLGSRCMKYLMTGFVYFQ